VLRIDPEADNLSVMDAGVIRCSPHESLGLRLAELAAGIEDVLSENDAGVVAVEQIYSHGQRPRTGILMAHARGVILLEAARRDCRILHVPATTVKRHMTGNGRARKEHMQRAVGKVLGLSEIPEPPDIADALAVAVCAASLLEQPARDAFLKDDLLVQ
jgi:crossover junction endodeoxyribonuclease RuvC